MFEPDQLPHILPEYYTRARDMMSLQNRAYFLAGAGDEATLLANETAFSCARIIPRPLRETGGGSTQISLLGQSHATPFMVAPFAYHRLLDPLGETATARGAQAQSIKTVVSAQSSVDLAQIRSAAASCDWFQLYWMGSRERTLELAEIALAAGYTVLVLTIDAPVQGVRDREIEAGFQLPPDVRAVNLSAFPATRFTPLIEGQSFVFDHIAHVLPNWRDVDWLMQSVAAPVLLKGILHPDDAARAASVGAAGVIVSNHGGRVLDRAPATLEMLLEVIKRVGSEYPVLMDGGIRRGVDIFIALALGAKAVLIGRPVVCGLCVAGELGVSHVLRLLRDELEIAMLLSGCASINDIHADMVHLKL
ncbi:alpha-hydroxy acid oxidase [Sulfitobacter guttiformis]|uniref:4-hydroxymandelate oxidase n=1 Tax=Sulfitobacter guttiformis TaxID=74349 RepID=A0A420DHF4_9RHOB|nr:alpha-hydroxy acid oxidase [Sulfitobacter guttiformis]KIN72629.1 FMN-dependent alpha-hydroxy acid dehydrogenase [Sulfitobacter guttiformis KCTC 32187]RKE93640.1 4-hydroxymandelate oxidase [Sulfitobacter guttiformis]